MICKKCGADNPHPWYEAVRLPVRVTPYKGDAPINGSIPVRWACRECGGYHFKDGSLYDYETAIKLGSEDGSALPK